MLANLFRGATGYRNNASLESATDDAHTRNLLYGQSQHIYSLAASPPPSPYGSPSFRPGSFDDHGGLEIEEKDIRILVAQDAYGSEEGPTLLFDSKNSAELVQGNAQAGQRSPLPADWRPNAPTAGPPGVQLSFRNRSSTISGAPSSWTRPTKDSGTREDAFLECMFGVTTSTKSASSTKMHIIPGRPKPVSPNRQTMRPPQSPEAQSRRTPLMRSRTSMQHPTLPQFEVDSNTDAVLITRLFSVSLPEHAQIVNTSPDTANTEADQASTPLNVTTPPSSSGSKRPKLVERRVPAFAIGLVLQLQQPPSRQASTHGRPGSRSAPTHAFGSASSSYGSDIQTSWTFLDAIPESLASSRTLSDEGDRRVDIIVSNWDVILRSMALLEQKAASLLREQLERMLAQVSNPAPKTPKEKSMQRINQRIIAITDPAAVAGLEPLLRLSNHTIRRITYAFRIPRVLTGHGLVAGHWTDETRRLYQFCGGKQQNFFLFNLLTAFLGNHTQWLERLAPDWYRKQFQATSKKHRESEVLASRTIIISDQKGIARRLIYILASFLPGPAGLEGLQKLAEDGTATPLLSTSSPSGRLSRNDYQRRPAGRRMHEPGQHVVGGVEKVSLSTSASSVESTAMSKGRDIIRKPLMRKDSDGFIVRPGKPVVPHEGDGDNLRSTAATGTTTATGQNPATPIAYISSSRDSYFPDGVVAETQDSMASADLSKILQRSDSRHRRTSSSVSSRWGSLVSGISEFWVGRQPSTGEFGSSTTTPPSVSTRSKADGSVRAPLETSSSLQRMVDQLDEDGLTIDRSSREDASEDRRGMAAAERRPSRNVASVPNLSVDDKDGVIDVDLDLPGFIKFSGVSNSLSSAIRSASKSTNTGRDGSESVCSLRSVPSMSMRQTENEHVNVGGYLRRFHEDFALHAVKNYPELVDDIKNSMRLERSLPLFRDSEDDASTASGWFNVCTTLLADTRNFSIRRLTLQRRVKPHPSNSETDAGRSSSDRRSSVVVDSFEENLLDETVMEFDTTLADAVEKVLNFMENAQSKTPHRASHSRSASASTNASARTIPKATEGPLSAKNTSGFEPTKQDYRHVVVGALEDVVKSVNDNLNRQSRDIREDQGSLTGGLATGSASKQENVLREGVKQWLLNVEQTKVW